ncbi:MAG: hypothetical protein L0H64_01175 [Pseudonocardia sp.]|nr:hypothetical protein [Pseudonocardia sp.]
MPEWRRAGEQLYRASPMELGEALLRLLSSIAGTRGSVLVLEDLHWADLDTVAVLEYVGDNIGSVPVLCVATVRSDATTPALRVARELAARRSADLHELRRLSPAEQARMTRLCLGTKAPPDVVDDIVARFSDGLPFLVEELLASAVPGASSGVVVPERFADLVARQLALLPEDAARVLIEAAVLGPRILVDVLPVVTGASVVDPDEPRLFGFRHALTRDALLAQVLPVRASRHLPPGARGARGLRPRAVGLAVRGGGLAGGVRRRRCGRRADPAAGRSAGRRPRRCPVPSRCWSGPGTGRQATSTPGWRSAAC